MAEADLIMDEILVIGATGNVGRQVVVQLLATGAAVRALAREPQFAELRGGVNVAGGDLTRPDTVEGALAGSDTAASSGPCWRA
ncbi:SDR family oxidoreductase [Streptomyces spiralis]